LFNKLEQSKATYADINSLVWRRIDVIVAGMFIPMLAAPIVCLAVAESHLQSVWELYEIALLSMTILSVIHAGISLWELKYGTSAAGLSDLKFAYSLMDLASAFLHVLAASTGSLG
jgi:hypothetical protein